MMSALLGRTLLCAIVAAAAPAPLPAWVQLDGPIPSAKVTAGMLSFDAHATVGDFTGTTRTVTGEMQGGEGLAAVRGWVEAPVKTLETGDKKRDKDLNKSMETDKHPTMRFDLTGVKPVGATGDSSAVQLQGKLTLHGVTREVTLPGKVWKEGNGLRLRSDFPVNVKDYKVGGLSKMLGMLRMQEGIEVHVDLTFTP